MTTQTERLYTVGYRRTTTGEGEVLHSLKPMTHKQARTFITKMMAPADYFLVELPNTPANHANRLKTS